MKKPTTKEQQLANKIIKELQDAGYTPNQMLKVIARAKEIHKKLQGNKLVATPK